MSDIPLDAVTLENCRTGERVRARIVDLTRELAQNQIDAQWWAILSTRFGVGFHQRATAEDHHWIWYKKVGGYRNDHFCRCVAIQTPDSEIQGAMIYHLNGSSQFEPGQRAVFINYLATAPWNRPELINPLDIPNPPDHLRPLYKGVGGGFITLAKIHSYEIGYRGRVNLQSLKDAEEFYKRQNFSCTGTEIDGMVVFELRSSQAMSDLSSWGLL